VYQVKRQSKAAELWKERKFEFVTVKGNDNEKKERKDSNSLI
jgi:hypothetical protein